MPWIGCELWVGECAPDGSVGCKRLVAGRDDESIFQPEWSPDGTLYFVSDRAQPSLEGRWWNLFRVRGDAFDDSVRIAPVYPLAAEFGRAQWVFRAFLALPPASHLVLLALKESVKIRMHA